MIIWSSINCPTVICLPTICYFSWEKPLVKCTAPRVYSLSYFPFRSIFICFCFQIYYSKNPKISCYILFVIYLILRLHEIYLSNLLQTNLPFYPWGIDNPSYTSSCKYLLFVRRYHLHSVAWFSYWIGNLGFITEGNTYRSCAASSLPLRGNTDAVSNRMSASKGIFCAVAGETLSTSIRFLITNLISLQF